MAEDYGWPPDVVNSLTMYQVRMYCLDPKKMSVSSGMSKSEVMQFSEARKRQIRSMCDEAFQRIERTCQKSG